VSGRVPAAAALIGLAAVLGAATPARCVAQTDARLAAAVRLAQEGDGDSARATVQRILAAMPPTDTLYPQALLAAATTAGSTVDRQRALQRIAVEYPNSPWADDALLGLAELSYAAGDLPGAAKNLERLRLDYPATPLLGTAAVWAAKVYTEAKDPASACRWAATGTAAAGNDLELRNQLAFYGARCQGVDTSTATADSSPAPSPSVARPKASPAPTAAPAHAARKPVFRIQIIAAPDAASANRAAARLRAVGIAPVVAHEGGFWKVRGGSYATRAEAQAALAKIRARLSGAPFIVSDSISPTGR
jgi:cell division septation protein DedD